MAFYHISDSHTPWRSTGKNRARITKPLRDQTSTIDERQSTRPSVSTAFSKPSWQKQQIVAKCTAVLLTCLSSYQYTYCRKEPNFKALENGILWLIIGHNATRRSFRLRRKVNKKALLSQRRPRDAPNIWVSWDVWESSLRTRLLFPKFVKGFCSHRY